MKFHFIQSSCHQLTGFILFHERLLTLRPCVSLHEYDQSLSKFGPMSPITLICFSEPSTGSRSISASYQTTYIQFSDTQSIFLELSHCVKWPKILKGNSLKCHKRRLAYRHLIHFSGM